MKTSHISAQAHIDSPLGGMTLAATPAGLAGLWFDAQAHHPGPIEAPVDEQQPHIAQASEELAAYWLGTLTQFKVVLDAHGTDFQRAVWQALCRISLGQLDDRIPVAADDELFAVYRDEIPVAFVDGRQHDFWRVDPDRLRAALTRTVDDPGSRRRP